MEGPCLEEFSVQQEKRSAETEQPGIKGHTAQVPADCAQGAPGPPCRGAWPRVDALGGLFGGDVTELRQRDEWASSGNGR